MKQQQHDIECMENSGKESKSQGGFEPTTLRDLVGCSNHRVSSSLASSRRSISQCSMLTDFVNTPLPG